MARHACTWHPTSVPGQPTQATAGLCALAKAPPIAKASKVAQQNERVMAPSLALPLKAYVPIAVQSLGEMDLRELLPWRSLRLRGSSSPAPAASRLRLLPPDLRGPVQKNDPGQNHHNVKTQHCSKPERVMRARPKRHRRPAH